MFNLSDTEDINSEIKSIENSQNSKVDEIIQNSNFGIHKNEIVLEHSHVHSFT